MSVSVDPIPSALAARPLEEPVVSASGLKFLTERRVLINEAHARPPVNVPLNSGVTRLTLTAPSGPNGEDLAFLHLQRMCAETSNAVPAEQSKHHVFDAGSLRVIWERHTEFYSLTFIRSGIDDYTFQETALSSVPKEWLTSQPGEILSATHVLSLPSTVYENPFEIAAKTFGRDDFPASRTGKVPMTMATDFRTHADGFLRILIFDQGNGDAYRGRMVQRLLEMDAYRLAALMALPVARYLSEELGKLEQELETILSKLAGTMEMQSDRALLADLSLVAARIEALEQETGFRMSASAAYYEVVRERIVRLREERTDSRQRIGTFMERRLGPAMRTCQATEQRLQKLATRVSRASQLLRTRVNVAVEEGNARLLESLNKRSETQLRLQETVEGLSVVALTYYAVGLVSYVAGAAVDAGIAVPKNLIVGLSVPIIASMTLLTMRRMRQRLHKDSGL
ncbi:MAG: DUF3422 domain-containing protein [Pseudomonadota bacterium]